MEDHIEEANDFLGYPFFVTGTVVRGDQIGRQIGYPTANIVVSEKYKLIHYYTMNEWELFDLEKDPDEMENLWEWSGFKVHPGYENIAKDLVAQLQQLREKYKDTTGAPIKVWPLSSYD